MQVSVPVCAVFFAVVIVTDLFFTYM
jgi:hypothetical protein